MTRLSGMLEAAAAELEGSSDSPALDAEILLAHVLGRPRAFLRAHADDAVARADHDRFRSLLARRLAGEPVAYLTGRRGFWSLDLEVDPGVLVPRPETELLVEAALDALADRPAPQVLDLGVGSGAIAIAIAVEMPSARVTAVDASAAALEVARRNAVRAGVENIEFLQGDWFQPLAGRRFDAIVANPPYLAANDPHLPALAHEPAGALVAGPTGLEALEKIAAGAPERLRPGGIVILEHGSGQGAAVRVMCARAGLQAIQTRRDLAGHERATLARGPTRAGASG